MATSSPTILSSPIDSETTSKYSGDESFSVLSHEARGSGHTHDHRTQVPIAVVGMGCRLPGHSNSPTALWDFLQRGGIAKNEPPKTRFSLAGHYDGTKRPRTMKSPGGMFMEDVNPEVFDGQFFNISRTDCIAMDPQQRQILEVAYECLENAGVPLEQLSGTRTGVIVGTNFIDYNAIQNRDPEDRADSITSGVASSILSNRVSHFLNINGPSMTIDTACSASLVSVDVACRYLDSFGADAMLVGGANMWLTPEHNEEIGMMHMTQSASGKCHSFDAKADGYVKAEGINVVYLKRLSDAIRDGNPIRAVIRGTAANASGRTAGIANPSSDAQAAVTRTAYKNAGIKDFHLTQFLECHGTGTLAGDPVEVRGAASVFAQGREDGQELVIGSIKSNIGHSGAAAGLSGLLKATLALESGIIPGNPTFTEPNPNIDWKVSRVRASRTSVKWPGTSIIRRASLNSFGFGGANAHAVLENSSVSRHISSYKQVTTDFFDDDDEEEASTGNKPTPTLLVFSANDQSSLKNYTKSLSSHLLNPMVSINVEDLAYTLSERRTRHYYRGFAISRSSKATFSDESLVFGKQAPSPPRIGFVFTGQGAQWSQMGADLVNDFPLAKKVIQELDEVLQALVEPPSWSLLEELSQPRDGDALRQPEFSQPLVTALQLALMEVLEDWGIHPKAVVGHSSGEIAAAAAAGLMTHSDAIKTAYYRGQAAKKVGASSEPVGMLAVGVGPEVLSKYLRTDEAGVQIACYNSPSSLTISGTVSSLKSLSDRLQADGHFARALRVDLAYHSSHMKEIGEVYEAMLLNDEMFEKKPNFDGKPRIQMFSSVTGKMLLPTDTLDAAYWKRNMVSPVQFTQAASELLSDTEAGGDFIIELGPSNALSGPLTQIKKSLSGPAGEAQYTSALKRGAESTLPLYDAAGKLFLAGGSVDLNRVNRIQKHSAKVVIDLPNYAWNHSTSYWHETRASKDWRFKKFVNHDLIGSKILGTAWQAPVFKKVLKIADIPWVRDHKLGSDVVFPAAGYVAMAVEAMYQTAMVTQWGEKAPARYRFRLRDVKLLRALVLEEDVDTRLTLALTPAKTGTTRSWYEYRVCSVHDGVDIDNIHSSGLVCIETDYQDTKAAPGEVAPLELATPVRVWYKALADMGYNFGPCFQKHLMLEASVGKRKTRSMVNLEPPPSIPDGQSSYPLHPAVMDACFQAASPALWNGDLPPPGASVLVPKIIDSIVIEAGSDLPVEGMANSTASFLGVGDPENPRNYATNVDVYNSKDGTFLFQMKGLASAEIQTTDDEKTAHTFTRVAWDADITLLMASETSEAQDWFKNKSTQNILDLVAHKKPNLKVLELNMTPEDASSLWIQDMETINPIRAACSEIHLAMLEPKTLIGAQERMSAHSPSPQFHLINVSKPAAVATDVKFDLAIVKAISKSEAEEAHIIDSLCISVREGGFVLAIGFNETVLGRLGKTVALGENVCICQVRKDISGDEAHGSITHVSLLGPSMQQESCMIGKVADTLSQNKWIVYRGSDPLKEITSSETVVIILDELFHTVMDRLEDRQWDIIKHLTRQRCRLLWVTTGAHLSVTDPTKAAIVGLFRTIRAEEQLDFATLDVESATGPATVGAISTCLKQLCAAVSDPDAPRDLDFVERGGVVCISRLLPDKNLTAVQSDELSVRPTEVVDIHACKTLVTLRCERLGNLDAVHFGEVEPEVSPLADGTLEVEVYAAGLNYKDVVVTMGIVPGDETALGHEAAGVVTRVASGVSDFVPGDRVVLFGKGCFANRMRTTPARVHRIPANMSFEEAATLSVVYLTSMHSLFDLANLSAGKRLLIHSAAGGVGIAAIQLAKYVGADVFTTVGTPEKREFLRSTFGLSDDRIFNSRNTDFAAEILAATGGAGVDVVLNSLTGDMLDESFRILADGGIMVEIGKKDILDRGNLCMAPFDRNISFRAVDLSPERAPDALVARHLSKLFELINDGHVAPINPIHRFSWSDIPSAIRFLRSGKHMGKIVLSDGGADAKIHAPIRRSPKNLSFRDDGCYLIIGGLRGLCASLAIYLAKAGAKHLAVMSRSGYADDKSRHIVKQINGLGAHIDLLTADVTVADDVQRAFQETKVPIAGIIQGAMVLRDRPFDSMTLKEYHEAVQCKIQGTWNLHSAAEAMNLDLDFFTLLSSISGVIGNRGQANYAAANVFLDAFAAFRQARGQRACSVDLGVIEDAGVIAENAKLHEQFDWRTFKGINDGLLRKILYLSILQQQELSPPSLASRAQMITGLIYPQPVDSILKSDARFSALFTSQNHGGGDAAAKSGGGGNAEVQGLLLLLRTKSTDTAAIQKATVEAVNGCFVRMLRLAEPMDPARPLAVYGIDSLAAVEVRNWVRAELGALVTTLDIMNATSLTTFCDKIITKMANGEEKK
ncbi:Lovastatin diketide synthase LovF 17 [Arthroderma uncinatum]|uniref:Lovastatin diketide synthase LovF 17 n=1 Tax=Arthroderma uncinatum TaxID=74035 RepID=UPI00144A7397|nr:Lovastatin diketide synthase LovF 17 [Arthroderma uncinatum]KAF3490687.1 Lovastatin diketide synthase LovF 17 [Arthroderma uncinatum]